MSNKDDEWSVSYSEVNSDARFNLMELDGRIEPRRPVEKPDFHILNVGVEANYTTVKAESDWSYGTRAVSGPSAGFDAGVKVGTDPGVSAMVELSAVKAEGTLGPLYGSVGLNADTGLKLGDGGLKANLLGFGFNLGVNGKFTIDSPFGSLGASQAQTIENVNRNQNRHQYDAQLLTN